MISIVFPLYNEIKHGFIQRSLMAYKELEHEIIIIDGGSTDGTLEYIMELGFKPEILKNSSRLARIKLGLEKANGDKIIIHHPRSILEIEAFNQLIATKSRWGGFTHKFDHLSPLLNFTSFYSNIIRADKRNIFYLDHCFYLNKELKDLIYTIKDCEIFEDTEISLVLRRIYSPKRLSAISTTSSVRFLKRGILKQMIFNQKMKVDYYIKKDHKKMNKEYERDLNFNNDVDNN